MTAWPDLLAAAIAGTARGQGELDEQRLLAGAARMAVRRAAGERPAQPVAEPPDPCPEESVPYVSPAAAGRLAGMLGVPNPELLPEWLELAAWAGRVVPPELLPRLLDLARLRADLAAPIRRVAGTRGRWLEALNPDWTTAVPASGEAALRRARASDPEAARRELEAGWAAEPHERRASLLLALGTGLSMADEPFLESCLIDRRKDVRSAAADLEARLPESRLVARMRARVAPLVRVRRRALRTGLTVTPPAECDAAMVADGIEPRPPSGAGRRAWWLSQLVERVPPSTWPTEALGPALAGEWSWALARGWARAALRFADAAWAEALLVAYAAADPAQRWRSEIDPRALLRLVPEPGREALVLRQLDRGPAGPDLLAWYPEPWSGALSRAALPVLAAGHPQVIQAARRLCDPALADALEMPREPSNQEWIARRLDDLAAVLRERADMRRELTA